MNWKKLGLATLAGTITMLIVGGLWEGISAKQVFYSLTHSGGGAIAMNIVAYLVLAALMAYIYPLGYEGRRPAYREGLQFGALVGVLMILPHGLAVAGASGDRILYAFENTAWHAVEQGLGGIAIAYAYVTRQKKVKR